MHTGHSQLQFDAKKLSRQIERLNVPADMKVLLATLLEKTVVIGGKIINVGVRIMAFIFDLAKAYPGITFGIIVALVLSFLVNSIPVIGPILTPILTPILLIIGITYGAINDFTNADIKMRLNVISEQIKAAGIQ